jgi:hypothetical protein
MLWHGPLYSFPIFGQVSPPDLKIACRVTKPVDVVLGSGNQGTRGIFPWGKEIPTGELTNKPVAFSVAGAAWRAAV